MPHNVADRLPMLGFEATAAINAWDSWKRDGCGDAFALGREVPNHRLSPDWEGDDGSAVSRTLGRHDASVYGQGSKSVASFAAPWRIIYPPSLVWIPGFGLPFLPFPPSYQSFLLLYLSI